jgi:hyaluronan synthase
VINRSRPLTGWKAAASLIPLGSFLAYVVWANVGWATPEVWPLIAFFSTVAALTLAIMVAGVVWRSFEKQPLPVVHDDPRDVPLDLPWEPQPRMPRILAIVPVYNEDPALVRATVLSLIDQTVPPDQIHVVDDGSAVPLETFEHPLVHWHHQKNAGKRHAQATVLRMFSPNRWDFILTVDSDSVCDKDAVEHMLRPFSRPSVQASTGMILMRNWDENLLTRLVDINIVTSCLMFRMFRSWFGMVSPTSGALAVYRAPLVYDNLEDYVTSGTAGDDRRLSFYALLRGEVVGVPEAVVETQLPTTIRGTFMQRMRWSKSAWLGIPFVLTNMRMAVVVLYMYPLVFALMWPFVVTVLIKVAIDYDTPVFLYGVLFWVIVAVCMTFIYALYRPDFTWRTRVTQGMLGLIYPILGLIVLRPAAYWALTKLKSTSWHTRESHGPAAPQVRVGDPTAEEVITATAGTEPLATTQVGVHADADAPSARPVAPQDTGTPV